MHTRIIIALETITVIVLAVVIVIYGQVLWQQFNTPDISPTPEEELVETPLPEPDPVVPLTATEKMEILESLKTESAETLSAEEKSDILESLAESGGAPKLSEEEKMQVLKELQQ